MAGKPLARLITAGLALTLTAAIALPEGRAEEPARLPSEAEARRRAKSLHGFVHDTLQVVHSQYFREGERLMIPAASLDLVFQEMEEREGVKLRWLVVDGKAMNVDNNPQDEFEKAAAKALAAGEVAHDATIGGDYRFAGPIKLGSECLKCHLPSRSSNKPRTAGLLISIPIGKE